MFNTKILSIDIGSKTIKLVEGVQRSKSVAVHKALMIETPDDCINDGDIISINRLKKVLDEVITNQKIKANKVVFTTNSTSIITRIIEIPFARINEMDEIIRFEIEQYLPINFENYILQYKKLSSIKTDEGKRGRVSVAVFPKDMAKKYLRLAQELELNPYALDLTSNCINKLFGNDITINSENYSLDKTVAVIDLGYNYIELNIISNGVLEFTRTILGGGSQIDSQISSELYINNEEAEARRLRFGDLSGAEEPKNLHQNIINNSIKAAVDRIIREIDKMLDYFRNRNRDKVISTIYLHGGCSDIKGLAPYMESALNVKVCKIEDMSNIVVKSTGEINKEFYLNAIGGIIRLNRW